MCHGRIGLRRGWGGPVARALPNVAAAAAAADTGATASVASVTTKLFLGFDC